MDIKEWWKQLINTNKIELKETYYKFNNQYCFNRTLFLLNLLIFGQK